MSFPIKDNTKVVLNMLNLVRTCPPYPDLNHVSDTHDQKPLVAMQNERKATQKATHARL